MIATLDTATLKAALMQLAVEEPNFLQELLHTLPQKNGNVTNGVSEHQYIHDTEDGVNPLLRRIVAEDFAEYETVFKKLA
jgi:hypothetical protein